jgi:GntP family gluconate:H+ symporter
LDQPRRDCFTAFIGAVWNNLPVPPFPASPGGSWFLVACAAGTVLLLLLLVAKVRLHPALALAAAAIALGVASGMPLRQVPLSFTTGVGNLLGHIAIVLGLGAVLGRLLASSGGAAALGRALVDGCGQRGLPWALLALGILVGMPVFFEVGLVLLMPIVAEAARRSGRPPILVGMPLLAGLSIVHGTLPPHPAAMLAATQFHADLGRTILFGLAAGLPAAALAGPGLSWFLIRRWQKRPGALKAAYEASTLFTPSLEEDFQADAGVPPVSILRRGNDTEPSMRIAGVPPVSPLRPGNGATSSTQIAIPQLTAGPLRAATAILLPVALIFLGSWADALAAPATLANQILHLVGSPDIALLIAVLVALVTLGTRIPSAESKAAHHPAAERLRKLTSESFEPIANVLLILAAA